MARVLALGREAGLLPDDAAARIAEERIAAARAVKRPATTGTLPPAGDRR